MKRRNLVWLLMGSMLSSAVWAESNLNLTQGVTAVSREVYDLHMLILYICTAIGIVVFGAMFWSMFFHRKSKGVKPADFHESNQSRNSLDCYSNCHSSSHGYSSHENTDQDGRQFKV